MAHDSRHGNAKLKQSTTAGSGQFADYLLIASLLTIVGVWLYSRLDENPAMPKKIEDIEEIKLYSEPGGVYTLEDIAANGGRTASEKFVGFRAEHDFSPVAGDRVCPITRTKANPDCDWIIAGQRYEFCCPPCIDEFLMQAKRSPERILPADQYVK